MAELIFTAQLSGKLLEKQEQRKMVLAITESLTYGALGTATLAIAAVGTVTLPIMGLGAMLGFGLWATFKR